MYFIQENRYENSRKRGASEIPKALEKRYYKIFPIERIEKKSFDILTYEDKLKVRFKSHNINLLKEDKIKYRLLKLSTLTDKTEFLKLLNDSIELLPTIEFIWFYRDTKELFAIFAKYFKKFKKLELHPKTIIYTMGKNDPRKRLSNKELFLESLIQNNIYGNGFYYNKYHNIPNYLPTWITPTIDGLYSGRIYNFRSTRETSPIIYGIYTRGEYQQETDLALDFIIDYIVDFIKSIKKNKPIESKVNFLLYGDILYNKLQLKKILNSIIEKLGDEYTFDKIDLKKFVDITNLSSTFFKSINGFIYIPPENDSFPTTTLEAILTLNKDVYIPGTKKITEVINNNNSFYNNGYYDIKEFMDYIHDHYSFGKTALKHYINLFNELYVKAIYDLELRNNLNFIYNKSETMYEFIEEIDKKYFKKKEKIKNDNHNVYAKHY